MEVRRGGHRRRRGRHRRVPDRFFGTRPSVQRLLALGRQIAGADGPPAPELSAEVQRLQARLKTLARITLALITISVIAMATARYW
jgi:NAD-dependent oxidoreductase involved in siderophore biosynthesis